MDAPPVASVFSALVEAGRDCSHTFGLGERRLAAGPDGMSWLTPDQIGGLLRSLEPGRIRQPRSDLFCHHFEDACAICGMRVVERKRYEPPSRVWLMNYITALPNGATYAA
jgi:hypothetical protein